MYPIACCLAVVLVTQLWSGVTVVSRSTELRRVLSEGHIAANLLERHLGYGGLVHNFKNYLLRPHESEYRALAITNATDALEQMERVGEGAESIGVPLKLDATRSMIERYVKKLDKVQELSANGRDARYIDAQLRGEDQFAMQEVFVAIDKLDLAVDVRLKKLQQQGTISTVLSTVSTAALGMVLISFVARRQRRHVRTLSGITHSLTDSNAKLVKANASLEQFAKIVSHDLKAPLRHVNMFSEMIVEDSEEANVRDHAMRIDKSVVQMREIIDSLLDFTRTGFTELNIESVNLRELLRELEYEMQPELEDAGIQLVFDVRHDEPVPADRVLLLRVLCNLVGNSVKYAHMSSPVRVVVSSELVNETDNDTDNQFPGQSAGECIVCSVSDNGIGIDARYAEKIFEPMERLHGADEAYEGVGMGLAIAKIIVETHGGLIWLDTQLEKGTRMTFSLPLRRVDEDGMVGEPLN